MAIQTPAVLKSYFPTDSYSTEQEFVDLIDSCTNTLITGDMTVDSNNVATVNPIKLQTISEYSTTVTRLASQGSGTVTVSVPFAPKLVFATTSSVNTALQSGGIGRSNGTDNSCVYGRSYSVGGNFNGLSQTSRGWFGMTVGINGDVYSANGSGGDIYKQSFGIGNFNPLSQTNRNWSAMTTSPNGNVYASDQGGLRDIYMQTNGVGNFIALGQTGRAWYGMASSPNGNVYACVYGGDIYMQTAGIGNFIALSQTNRNWRGMAASPNGNIYACDVAGDIYMQTNGSGNFNPLSQTSRDWYGITATPNGDIYSIVFGGDIYKQTGGTGNFSPLGQTSRLWSAITSDLSGNLYACVTGGDIYKQIASSSLIDNSSLNFSIANWQVDDTGFTGIINNFTSNSFDIDFTIVGAGVDTIVTLDVIK